MRVFAYEFTCATPAGAPATEGLQAEGWAMLAAVIGDLTRIPGVETSTLLNDSCPDLSGCRAVRISDVAKELPAFEALAAAADWTLVIAPEFEGLLADRCQRAQAVGGRLLGPGPAAVRLTADK